jgi:hypothetical protein
MPALLTRIVTAPSSFSARAHGLDRVGLRDVSFHRNRPPAPARDLGDERLGRVRLHSVVHAYGGAALREQPGRCPPEAARAAGHHRHLVTPLHSVPSSALDADQRKGGREAALLRH